MPNHLRDRQLKKAGNSAKRRTESLCP